MLTILNFRNVQKYLNFAYHKTIKIRLNEVEIPRRTLQVEVQGREEYN